MDLETTTDYYDKLHNVHIYNGRNQPATTYIDLLVTSSTNDVYLCNLLAKPSQIAYADLLIQQGHTGSLGPIKYENNVRYSRKNLYFKKTKKYLSFSSKIDEIEECLYVHKNIQQDINVRREFQKQCDHWMEENNATDPSVKKVPDDLGDLILAWDGNIRDQIYKVLWEKYNTPMLKDWKDYIVDALIEHHYYRPLIVQSFANHYDLKAGLLCLTERQFEQIISEGVKSYDLDFAMMEDGRTQGILENCTDLSTYLEHFAGALGERIKENTRSRFDPEQDEHSPAFKQLNITANQQGITGLFPPQADTVMGISKTLLEDHYCFVVGEMGTGKTAIGESAPYITESLRKHSDHAGPYRVLVYSPSIMVEKWKREIKERIPNVKVYEIKSWRDALALRQKPYHPTEIEYYVMNSDLAKYHYKLSPIKDWRQNSGTAHEILTNYRLARADAIKNGKPLPKRPRVRFKKGFVNWGTDDHPDIRTMYEASDTGFYCPHCGNPLHEKKKRIAGSHFFEQRVGSKWKEKIKVSTNWVCTRNVLTKELPKSEVKDKNKPIQECGYVLWQPEQLPPDSLKRKISPAWVINKKLRRGFFKYLIADEVHEYKSGDSEIGKAFGQLINATEKQILLTGTLMGGMSSDIFYLLARLDSKKLHREGIQYEDKGSFINRYGVYEIKYNSANQSVQKQIASNEKPGLSPHLFPTYLMSNCVFLELSDLGYALPPYQEIPVLVDMDSQQKEAYDHLNSVMKGYLRSTMFQSGISFVSNYINTMYQYCDAPFNMDVVKTYDEDGVEQILAHPQKFPESFVPTKFLELVNIIDDELDQGRKSLVYVRYSGNRAYTSMDTYLYDRLKGMGYNVGILRSSGSYDGIRMPVNSKGREKWLKQMMKTHNWDVLITNARLVKVGLDLLDFPNIIYYQQDYSVFNYMQSSRRSWRIKQTKPVKVYTLAYSHTIQQDVLNNIAQKIDAAMAMQGKFSEEGLRTMADSGDSMMALAKNLMNEGKLDNVNTIHDRFQKLNQSYAELQSAKYNTYDDYDMNPIEGGIEKVRAIANGLMEDIKKEAAAGNISSEALAEYLAHFEEVISVVEDAKAFNKGLKKKDRAVEGQLTLFA